MAAKKQVTNKTSLPFSAASLSQVIASLDMKVGVQSNAVDFVPFSTGVLSLDLAVMGRLTGGNWMTSVGREQSGKSTTVSEVLAQQVADYIVKNRFNVELGEFRYFLPLLVYMDYEGSLDVNPDGLFMHMVTKYLPDATYEEVFGLRDSHGNYTSPPALYWYKLAQLEVFFDYIVDLANNTLPDIIKIADKRFFKYSKSMAVYEQQKAYADVEMTRKVGALCVAAPHAIPYQMMIAADSFPAMNPIEQNKEEVNNTMALLARSFSKHIPRIRGFLQPKRIFMLGVNQLCEKPGVTHGNPNYEPAGNKLRFASDVRVLHSKLSLSSVKPPSHMKEHDGSKELVAEEGLRDGDVDIYSFIKLKTIKNKLGGLDNIEFTLRLWRSHNSTSGLGIDPVYDVFRALDMMGLVEKQAGDKYKILAFGFEKAKKTMQWRDFKQLVLSHQLADDELGVLDDIYDRIGLPEDVDVPEDLRRAVQKLVLSKRGVELFMANLADYKVEGDGESEIIADDD